jgi:hypothetical protein
LIWVEKHRSDLIWAGLTALAAWFAKGAPGSDKDAWKLRGVHRDHRRGLEFLEVPDFLANLGDSAHFLGIRQDILP